MTPLIRPTLTRPRKSQVVLEGTAAAVSTVLIAWLLLWFIYQGPNDLQVAAICLPPSSGDVPYLEADARGLSGVAEATGRVEPAVATAKVIEIVGRPEGPAVVSISSPMGIDADSLRPLELIRKVAKEANRDVLILLDMAQLDSDRELGAFGNAPYAGLGEQLAKEEAPKRNVLVLCSAAPGQKSWMIDGQGRSAFSYFVQKGLEGSARPSGERGQLRVEDLHRFVLDNTRAWVRGHRRGAIQTPMLLRVGPDRDAFSIPILKGRPVRPAELSAIPKGTTPAEPAVAEQGASRLLESLLEEWKRHDALKRDPRPPSRDAPARWRAYQSRLLLAERIIRASWNDPGAVAEAGRALKRAVDLRLDVAEAIKQAKAADDRFVFRPALNDDEGAQILNASLKYVTRKGLENLARPADPAAITAANLAAVATVGQVKVDQGGAVEPPPMALRVAATDRPFRYLELQLPAWAMRFHEAFGVATFEDDRRGSLLRDAVLKRLPAEAALATDRRGLDWIKETIKAGDELRRSVQDDIFAIDDDGLSADLLTARIADYGRKYEEAAARITRYHDARSLFEEVASKLPGLAEWEILDDLRDLDQPEGSRETQGPAPRRRRADVIASVEALGDALEKESEPDQLADLVARPSGDFAKLEEAFRDRVRSLIARQNAVEWRDLDDLLASPIIDWADRKLLLEKILAMESGVPEVVPATRPDESTPEPLGPVDPGFRHKALELARLDDGLRRLAAGPRKDEDDAGEFEKLRKAVRQGDSKDDREPAKALAAFADYSARVQAIRSRKREPDEARTESKVAVTLRAADRDVRFQTAAEVVRSMDLANRASVDLEAFARQSALQFHTRRLVEDFARNVAPLNPMARKEFAGFPTQDVTIREGTLAPELGDGPFAIDRDKRTMVLSVGLKSDNIPNGRAFVGIAPPWSTAGGKEEPKLDVKLEAIAGRYELAGALCPVGELAKQSVSFLVEQLTDTGGEETVRKPLQVKVFYRGRVNEGTQSKQIEVVCRKFRPAVLVEVSQDLDALARRYSQLPNYVPEDQFERNRGQGYLHFGGLLDLLITCKNNTTKAQVLVIETTLEPETLNGPPGEPPIKRTSEPVTLKPQESHPFKYRLTSKEVPVERPQVLVIKVRSPEGVELVKEHRVRFAQLRLDQYVTIDGVRKGDLLNVRVARNRDDPVTDPILFRDLKFSIDNKTPGNILPANGYLKRAEGENEVVASYRIFATDVELPWTVEVEGVLKTDKTKVR